MKKEIYLNYCNKCGPKENEKLRQFFPILDFTGIKTKSENILEGFCCKETKHNFNKYRENITIPYLAELDESLNYCEYFVRTKGNEGKYIKDDFEYEVNGLWDYKTTPDAFKKAYKEHFGDDDYYKLHNRYKFDMSKNWEVIIN